MEQDITPRNRPTKISSINIGKYENTIYYKMNNLFNKRSWEVGHAFEKENDT